MRNPEKWETQKNAQANSRRPDNVIARSALQIKSTLSMAGGGFKFSL